MAEKKQAPLNKLLTIYFYHTRLTRESYEEWKEYKFPGHILYGLPLLENYGIRSVMHKCKYFSGRLKLMLYATKEILFCKEKYDVLYATSFRGIEPVIFLRALGLYRKPIVIWHHTAVVTNPKPWREQISRLFYKGIDQMFLFSRKLIQDSQKTRKAPSHKLKLIHWGPDLPFYDHLLAEMPDRKPEGFISTGKENRDVDTLLQSFSATNEELDLYIAVSCGNINYKKILDRYSVPDSIHIHYTDGVIPYELGKLVARKSCIVICCLDFPYTVGLTTLVEAFALGIPVAAAMWLYAHEGQEVRKERLQQMIQEIAAGFPPSADTHGAEVVAKARVKGARENAVEGYPDLFKTWGPYYRKLREDPHRAHRTLLKIMSMLQDTNIYYRTDAETAEIVRQSSGQLLQRFSVNSLREAAAEFIRHNISPGGCADMLSLTILINAILR